jgi:hypothetical protein
MKGGRIIRTSFPALSVGEAACLRRLARVKAILSQIEADRRIHRAARETRNRKNHR